MTFAFPLEISEPLTMATDYLLAVQVSWFAYVLGGKTGPVPTRTLFWCVAFSMTALAALAGGTTHGFQIHFGNGSLAWMWGITIVMIAASGVLILRASLRSALHPQIAPGESRKAGRRWLKRGLYLTLAGAAVLLLRLSFNQHVNQDVLYHFVQMAGLYCLYRGALVLEGCQA
jgi:hypothetical protein